jgi:hypothetical protein
MAEHAAAVAAAARGEAEAGGGATGYAGRVSELNWFAPAADPFTPGLHLMYAWFTPDVRLMCS